ncbi:MAG: isocitrate lyase/PEP mutase family protein, partial [Alphaproteobacteria bacterium]|nr:isocitrate lyase/PEP mutase family protein [Alphaproteobacteria bacterium]
MTATRRLRELLAQPGLVMAGGAHDALSAKIVEQVGYQLCVVTGAGVSMCRGYPDIGLVTMPEMVENARYIAEAVKIPVVADADNGYGNALNVIRTVREFERAGVAGIHIEDQVWPKRCGHMFGKRVIPKEEMVGKIKAALDARHDRDFVIIARCDALMVNGVDDVLDRGEAYREAGADMIFFEMRESTDEIKAMAERFRGRVPLHFNHSPSGMVPRLHVSEIERLGFKTACFYVHALMAACKTMFEVLSDIKRTGNSVDVWDRMISFEDFW